MVCSVEWLKWAGRGLAGKEGINRHTPALKQFHLCTGIKSMLQTTANQNNMKLCTSQKGVRGSGKSLMEEKDFGGR